MTDSEIAQRIDQAQQQMMEQVASVAQQMQNDMQEMRALINRARTVEMKQAPIQGFPFGKQYVFGINIPRGNSSVIIYNPMLRRYGDPQGSAICYTCEDATVTFGGDGNGQRIVWKWKASEGLSINSAPQNNDPIDDSTYIYGVVAIFDVSGGVISLAKGGIVQCGQIITLPVFSKATT